MNAGTIELVLFLFGSITENILISEILDFL